MSIHTLLNFTKKKIKKSYIRGRSIRELIVYSVQISELISRMQKEWETLACPSGDGMKFWGHEWEKHGTCSSLQQRQYFQAALDLKDKSNLLQVLGDAGTFFKFRQHYRINLNQYKPN